MFVTVAELICSGFLRKRGGDETVKQGMGPVGTALELGVKLNAQEKGVVLGTFTDSADTLKTWMEAGVRYLSYSVDVGIFTEACAGLRARFDAMRASCR